MSFTLDSVRLAPRTQRRIVSATWVLAWFGLVAGQLHALARHATVAGRDDLDQPLTRAWSVPASEALAPRLTWSDPQTVYVTYGRLWIPVYVASALCAFVVRRHRRPGRLEAWGWRAYLTGAVLMALQVTIGYLTPWTDEAFVLLAIPAVVLTVVGAPLLGVALLRAGFRPRVTTWVLVLWLPLFLAITSVTSMGTGGLPAAFAWAFAAGRLLRRDAEGAQEAPAVQPVRG
ncbi:MAG TPA: hypothetical protein VLQ78_03880 [Ornithinibacter sp.]|nr:hypothetical protein [Ornithinibacter sp.]